MSKVISVPMTQEDVEALKKNLNNLQLAVGAAWLFSFGVGLWGVLSNQGPSIFVFVIFLGIAILFTFMFRFVRNKTQQDISVRHKHRLDTTIVKKVVDRSGKSVDYKLLLDGFPKRIDIPRPKWKQLNENDAMILEYAPVSEFVLLLERKADGLRVK